jgi:DNA recombination protein RmuC
VALEQDPDITDYCFEKRVILASPSTLFGLLKVIEYGWRQEVVTTNLEELRNLTKDMHERTFKVSKGFREVGTMLEKAVKIYNGAMSTFENRLLVTTRSMKKLGGVSGDEILMINAIDATVRESKDSVKDNLKAEEVIN